MTETLQLASNLTNPAAHVQPRGCGIVCANPPFPQPSWAIRSVFLWLYPLLLPISADPCCASMLPAALPPVDSAFLLLRCSSALAPASGLPSPRVACNLCPLLLLLGDVLLTTLARVAPPAATCCAPLSKFVSFACAPSLPLLSLAFPPPCFFGCAAHRSRLLPLLLATWLLLVAFRLSTTARNNVAD